MAAQIAPAERLLNLVIALVNTAGRMTKEQVRTSVAGYQEAPSDDAFERMFERDKDTLRDLGIPILTVTDAGHGDDIGYRVDLDAYALPPLDLTAAELGVLAMAAQVWQDQSRPRGHHARADQAARGRRGARVDRPGRGPRAPRARGWRGVRAAGRRRAGAAGRAVHLPGGDHGRGARAHRRAVEAAGPARRLGPRGPRPRPRREPLVPAEPARGRRPHGRRARLVHRADGRGAGGGAARPGGAGRSASRRWRSFRSARAPPGRARCPRPPTRRRRRRTGGPRAATSSTCRSAPSGSWRRSWSATATRWSSSPRRACAPRCSHLLRTAATLDQEVPTDG